MKIIEELLSETISCSDKMNQSKCYREIMRTNIVIKMPNSLKILSDKPWRITQSPNVIVQIYSEPNGIQIVEDDG